MYVPIKTHYLHTNQEQETPTNGKEEEEDMLRGLAASAQVV